MSLLTRLMVFFRFLIEISFWPEIIDGLLDICSLLWSLIEVSFRVKVIFLSIWFPLLTWSEGFLCFLIEIPLWMQIIDRFLYICTISLQWSTNFRTLIKLAFRSKVIILSNWLPFLPCGKMLLWFLIELSFGV